MTVSKLFRFLLTRCFSMGIVEEGGGAAVLEDDPEAADPEAGEEDAAGGGEEGDDAGEGGEEDAGDGGETDEVTITIGDEPAPTEEDDSQAKPWVRELRKSHREQARRIRELEQQVSSATPAPQAVTLGPEPTFEGCNYDAEKFKTELMAWNQRKLEIDAETARKQRAAEDERKSWQARLDNHAKLKTELKVKDFDEAEAAVETALNVTQRGLIVHGADNSAQMFYALGKNPKALKDLAAITDPVKFAFAVAKLETKLKVTPRKTAPVPERDVRGSVSPASGVGGDKVLAKLQAEADKTGDRSKVSAYIRKQKQAQR